jgi:hypothetical protein
METQGSTEKFQEKTAVHGGIRVNWNSEERMCRIGIGPSL